MKRVDFLKSASKVSELPEDSGSEVAFLGRSNVGKSSTLNTLCQRKGLAKVSKTPGRTRLFNLFSIDDNHRLVDLPGYGYAKVDAAMKAKWVEQINLYLTERKCLRGVVLIMDIRHPLKELDLQIIEWTAASELPCLVLLNKADKLNRNEAKKSFFAVEKALKNHPAAELVIFSALKNEGVAAAREWLTPYFG